YPDGTRDGTWGIWARKMPDGKPIYVGGPAPGGHAQWSSFDPDWFVANVSKDWDSERSPYSGMIVMGSPTTREIKVIANPYDRQREGGAGFDGIPRPNQSPDATKAWYHSSMLMPHNKFTGSYIVVFRRPYAPTELRIEEGKLAWAPHDLSHEVRQWMVYRKQQDNWTLVGEVPKAQTSFDLSNQPQGTFMVTALEWSGLESDVSSATINSADGKTGESVRNWDQTAPAAPAPAAVVKEEPGQFRLTW